MLVGFCVGGVLWFDLVVGLVSCGFGGFGWLSCVLVV